MATSGKTGTHARRSAQRKPRGSIAKDGEAQKVRTIGRGIEIRNRVARQGIQLRRVDELQDRRVDGRNIRG